MTKINLISLKEVLAIYPVSKATLYRQIEKGEFPKNIKIGARRVAWFQEDVELHIQSLKKQSQ